MTEDKAYTAVAMLAIAAVSFVMGRDWDDFRDAFARLRKRRAAVRLSAGLIVLAGVIALTGCSDSEGAPVADASACYPPLACGPFYPVPVYPYMVHPYYGYLTPVGTHVSITVVNGQPRTTYRPYTAPIIPGYRPPPPAAQRAAQPAKQAPAAKPAAPRPAAPAPRPAARK